MNGQRFTVSSSSTSSHLVLSVPVGDVMHLHAFGRNIIVLSSHQAATDLLDKRGANYSDRPKMVIIELSVYIAHSTRCGH
jgi:hypothetical protein